MHDHVHIDIFLFNISEYTQVKMGQGEANLKWEKMDN